jgi:hypothetical protein
MAKGRLYLKVFWIIKVAKSQSVFGMLFLVYALCKSPADGFCFRDYRRRRPRMFFSFDRRALRLFFFPMKG